MPLSFTLISDVKTSIRCNAWSPSSYVVSHGLGPYYHEILVKDMKLAPSFTLGLDSATTKQLGLSKSLDFKVRYFSERFGMVSFQDFI